MKAAFTMTILAIVFASLLEAQEPAKNSAETTIQGCLRYTRRQYVLTETNGTAHQLSGSSRKLKPHIGHEVEVTGTEGVHTRGTTQQGAASSAHMTPIFRVSAVKHIADSCTAGNH
jgi:hypothetical protein